MVESRLRVIEGRTLPEVPVAWDPWQFQELCVEAFVASWRARGFSPVTVENDIDRVVGGLTVEGRAPSTRRGYVQVFKGFHRFLQARKAVEIEAAFGVRPVCPVDEFNASRHVGDDSLALLPPPTPERVEEFLEFLKARIAANTHPLPGTTPCSGRCITPACARKRPRSWTAQTSTSPVARSANSASASGEAPTPQAPARAGFPCSTIWA
ncbi:hypothetical protein ACFWAR_00925 [Streptomyces sp. NPDC059917]|uniref:hypothetical protein n=1 Tax=Streptomyces sp. NPDC059917 TaxID=3347002 RepID=UPI00365B31AD